MSLLKVVLQKLKEEKEDSKKSTGEPGHAEGSTGMDTDDAWVVVSIRDWNDVVPTWCCDSSPPGTEEFVAMGCRLTDVGTIVLIGKLNYIQPIRKVCI